MTYFDDIHRITNLSILPSCYPIVINKISSKRQTLDAYSVRFET